MDYKTLLFAFVFYLVSIWIGGYINTWVGLSATGDFIHVIAFSFIPFAIFWIIWTKWGKQFAATKA